VIVVANAGPLIALAQIEHLHLLPQLFGNIKIPVAIENEVVSFKVDRPGAKAVNEAEWIQVISVQNQAVVQLLRERLDMGESEAVALAIELKADLLLIDEARGRRVAETQGLNKAGTIGALIMAKRLGFIQSVRPLLDKLLVCGFRMDQKLYRHACQLAGEEA